MNIGNLQIYPRDLSSMEWYVATKICLGLGDGWRLPTKEELNVIYVNREIINGLSTDDYWSSTHSSCHNRVWGQYFANGFQLIASPSLECRVRPVRDSEEQTQQVGEI